MPLRFCNVTVRNAAIWRTTKLFSRRLILMTIAMTNIFKSKPACRFWYYYVYLCHDYLEAIAINYVVLATLVSPLSINHDGFTTVLFYNGNPSIWKDGLHTEMAPTHDFVHTCARLSHAILTVKSFHWKPRRPHPITEISPQGAIISKVPWLRAVP